MWSDDDMKLIMFPIPYQPCMVYLPTCTIEINQMKVDIPYMDSMGMFASSRGVKQHSFRFAPESCSGDFFLMDGHSNRTNVLW